MASKFKFTSYIDKVNKDLYKVEKQRRTEAARHLVKKLKENLSNKSKSSPGEFPGEDSGDLKKGVMYQTAGIETRVGFGPPAQHAHLLEFGTAHRVTKKGKDSGQVLPRPVLGPTFEQEADEVERIINKVWL